MSDNEFLELWQVLLSVARTAQLIPIGSVEQLIYITNIGDALGPIVDPTKYRDGGIDNLEQQRVVAEGFLAFRRAIESAKKLGLERSK